MRGLYVLIVLLSASFLVMTSMSWGEEFCVSNAIELQNALTAAGTNGEHDVIKVVQGTYYGNFSFSSNEGKGITIYGGYLPGCLKREWNPFHTILDAQGVGRVLRVENTDGGSIYICGLTIQNGYVSGHGGGILASSSKYSTTPYNPGSVTIIGCVVRGNTCTGVGWLGGGIHASSMTHDGLANGIDIINNIVVDNEVTYSYGLGGGVFARSYSTNGFGDDILFSSNTIYGNRAATGAGVFIQDKFSNIWLYNNIIRENRKLTGLVEDIFLNFADDKNCNAWAYNNNFTRMAGETWYQSQGNINLDSEFVNILTGDYHLKSTSPCINAGREPDIGSFQQDIDGEPRIANGLPDIGADEYIPPLPIFDGHDFDGNGISDVSVWKPLSGRWNIKGIASYAWGKLGDIPVNGDYNGDGTTDVAVWRPSNGWWYIKGIAYYAWGTTGDIPVPGDYNGDGQTDIAVWRPSNGRWYIKGIANFVWGTAGDMPVPWDYNADGKTDMAVWRPSNGRWYIKGIGGSVWGMLGDIPVPDDYNGDGITDLAVWRSSNGRWYIKGIGGSVWGMLGDIPTPGDYNGDGTTDIAVWRPSNGRWYIKGIGGYIYGTIGDIPLVR